MAIVMNMMVITIMMMMMMMIMMMMMTVILPTRYNTTKRIIKQLSIIFHKCLLFNMYIKDTSKIHFVY